MTENDNDGGETYRFTGARLSRPSGDVERGDHVEPTESELRAFSDMFEPVDGGGENDDAQASVGTDDDPTDAITDTDEGVGGEMTRRDEDIAGEGQSSEGSADDGSTEAESFDIDSFMDLSYTEREKRVRNGDVDDHLAAIQDAETSSTVTEAVEERRDDLGGGE